MNAVTNISQDKLRVVHKRITKKDRGIVTNPEILSVMESIENGSAELTTYSIQELKSFMNSLIPDERNKIK